MASPIIATKLYIPQTRPNSVLRERLTQRLNQGLNRKLSLISASAGYGKTTLISEWLSACNRPSAWLSLDDGDNDLNRFLAYLIAALRTISENLGCHVLDMLQSPQQPPIEMILAELLNDIVKLPTPFILVLDDYHVIHEKSVHKVIAFLLEHIPPNMHLVITTREEPALPLVKLRVRNQVNDLGVSDLRFNYAETVAFLHHTMNIQLSEESISTLEIRTEGWIAGLQIAAVSLQGCPEDDRFMESISGNQRLLLDYLVEEVLQKQPEPVHKFLLYTSILDRLCGPLCDAVLMNDPSVPGDQVLISLERANLFVIPLDRKQQWYRYHHLFAESLRQRLRQHLAASAKPENLAELHSRAGLWYENNGFLSDAFRHAVASGNIELAARLAEGEGMFLHLRGEAAPVLKWLESLPRTELDARPSLWVIYGSALLITGKPTEIEPKLKAAEAAMKILECNGIQNDLIGMIAATRATVAAIAIVGQPSAAGQKLQAAEDALQLTQADDKTNDLVGHIASTHAASDPDLSQLDTVITQSRRALAYLNPAILLVRVTMLWLMGVAYQLRGDSTEAGEAYSETLSLSQRIGSNSTIIEIMATVGQGQLFAADNQLFEAEERYRSALVLAGDLPLPVVCEAYMGLALIRYEWNDLDSAMQLAEKSLRLARYINHKDILLTCELFFARLKLVQRDWMHAVSILADAKRFVREHRLLQRLPDIAALQILGMIQQGNLEEAMRLARMHELPLCISRVHLAKGDTSSALAVLESYRTLTGVKKQGDEQLRTLVLLAVVLYAHGEKNKSVQLLLKALERAEPGGCIRLFIDEGHPIIPLLTDATAYGRMPDYMDKLIAACEADIGKGGGESVALIESLTPREREVLQLIANGYSNRQIGERLFLALDTVKGHNRRIFEKLQVQRRTEAIALARKLGWIR